MLYDFFFNLMAFSGVYFFLRQLFMENLADVRPSLCPCDYFCKLSYCSSKGKESPLSLYYDITILHSERQVNVITSVHCHIVGVKFNYWVYVH